MINTNLEIIVASKDGLILEDGVKSNIDKEHLVNIATLIFGASEKLGEIFGKPTNNININYNNFKVNLFGNNESIIITVISKDISEKEINLNNMCSDVSISCEEIN